MNHTCPIAGIGNPKVRTMKFGSHETRKIVVSYDVDMFTDNHFVLPESTRLTDRQTDRKAVARVRSNRDAR